MKKPGVKDRHLPDNGNMQYRRRVPRNAKEASQFDNMNGKSLWENAILKELEALISMSVFKKLPASLQKVRVRGYQFLSLRMIFYVKVGLRRKYRLVIGGHIVD